MSEQQLEELVSKIFKVVRHCDAKDSLFNHELDQVLQLHNLLVATGVLEDANEANQFAADMERIRRGLTGEDMPEVNVKVIALEGRDVCEFCEEGKSEVYCEECDMAMCVENGCDDEVHKNKKHSRQKMLARNEALELQTAILEKKLTMAQTNEQALSQIVRDTAEEVLLEGDILKRSGSAFKRFAKRHARLTTKHLYLWKQWPANKVKFNRYELADSAIDSDHKTKTINVNCGHKNLFLQIPPPEDYDLWLKFFLESSNRASEETPEVEG